MSRLVQALRSLRAEPGEPRSVDPGRPPVVRPRRRDQHALLQNILKRLTLLGPAATGRATSNTSSVESTPQAETPAATPLAVSPTVEAPSPPVATRVAPQRQHWEAAVAGHLAEPEAAQNYRQLAERMLANSPPGVPQNLLLTGVGCPAEETLGRLAWTLAEMCGPVLMVDANRAHSPLTIQLQHSGAPGLEEILRGEPAPLLPTGHARLFFLPTGNRAGDASGESLMALGESLAKWRSSYPIVLIDGGDALSESARALARLCDATYLLVGLGTATTEAAREATRRFRATGGRLLGCIAVESPGFQ